MDIAPNRKSPPDRTESPTQVKQCEQDCRGITALPRELVETIFANLGGKDLLVCQRVTRAWKDIIDSTPMLPRVFYRHLHPLVPVPELPATINRYYSPSRWPSVGHWLESFSEQGGKLALELDGLVGERTRLFPERLFFSLAKLLAQAPVFACRKAHTIEHANGVNSANFSPDGRYVVTASYDHTAKVCECTGGQWQEITTLAHLDMVRDAYFSPTGDYCVTICWNWTLQIWEVLGGGEQWQSQATLRHFAVAYTTPCFSADGNYLVIFPNRHTTQIVQLVNRQWQKQTTLLDGHPVDNALFHPQEHLLVTVHDHVNVYIWRLVDKQWTNEIILHHLGCVHRIQFSPDGNHLLVTCTTNILNQASKTTYIYDRVDGVWLHEAATRLAGNVYLAHFSPKGDKLVRVSAFQAGFSLWQFSNNRWQEVLLPQAKTFTNGRFSPDGDRLLTPTKHNTAILWKQVDGLWQEQVTLHLRSMLRDGCFSPHGHHLVTIGYDENTQIWGIVDGTWQAKSCPSLGGMHEGGFSPDGLYFLARYRNTVNIWTFRQGQL